MKRLFNAHVQLIYKDVRGEANVSSSVADRSEFWWNERKPDEPSLWESKIYLGEVFFNEIVRHPVPIDMNTLTGPQTLVRWASISTCGRSPTGSSRLNVLRMHLSWQQTLPPVRSGPGQSQRQPYCSEIFVRDCLRELKKIKLAWPGLNCSLGKGVLILLPSTPTIAPSIKAS